MSLSRDELSLSGAHDFKPVQRFAIPTNQSATDVIKSNANLVPLDAHALECGTGINQVGFPVSFRQCQKRQTTSDFLFVRKMDVLQIAYVVNHNHARVGDRLNCRLRFPKFTKAFGLSPVVKRCELHIIKWEIPLTPSFPPTVNQGFHFLSVYHPLRMIVFSLIPDYSTDGKRTDRIDHAVIQSR